MSRTSLRREFLSPSHRKVTTVRAVRVRVCACVHTEKTAATVFTVGIYSLEALGLEGNSALCCACAAVRV